MDKKHSPIWKVLIASLLVLLCVPAGCKRTERGTREARSEGAGTTSIRIRSASFTEGARIPARHTADGENVSPTITFSGVPEGTKELSLIMDDPDAPAGTWVHWVIYKIPGNTSKLPEGIPRTKRPTTPPGSVQGKNSGKTLGYRGPSPPPRKPHRYYFKLYALDTELDLELGATKQQLLDAMKHHILAQGQLMGTYER